MDKYLHAPIKTKRVPKGIPYIISNEAAERFSFYGMKGILVIFSLIPDFIGGDSLNRWVYRFLYP